MFYFILYIIAIALTFLQLKNTPKHYPYSKHQQDLQNLNLYELLDELSATTYFNYYKINLELECPFSNHPQQCVNCRLNLADEDKIPKEWNAKTTNLFTNEKWHQDELQLEGDYVNLLLNNERYTGAQGQDVWGMIYRENSFVNTSKSPEIAFNNLISGLHTSISAQLCENWVDYNLGLSYPEKNQFFWRVTSFPARVDNLFTLYETLYLAVSEIKDTIKEWEYHSFNVTDDWKTKIIVSHLSDSLNQTLPLKNHFSQANAQNKLTMQGYIYNISTILNCLECQICKVYSKMQFRGIATALKIIMKHDYQLDRDSLTSLINTFTKISNSINIIEKMYDRRYNEREFALYVVIGVGFITVCLNFLSKRNK